MKIVSNIFLASVIALTAFFGLKGCGNDYVTTARFNEAYKELKHDVNIVNLKVDTANRKLDSLQAQVYQLQKQLAELKSNQDSLKAGQIVIYNAIKDLESQPRTGKSQFVHYLGVLLGIEK